jgi:hypothetical protein
LAAAILLREQQRARQPVPATRIALYLVLAEDQMPSMLHATSANAPSPTPPPAATKHSARQTFRHRQLLMVRRRLTQSYGAELAQVKQLLVMAFLLILRGLNAGMAQLAIWYLILFVLPQRACILTQPSLSLQMQLL